jgi:hypothetical protein
MRNSSSRIANLSVIAAIVENVSYFIIHIISILINYCSTYSCTAVINQARKLQI